MSLETTSYETLRPCGLLPADEGSQQGVANRLSSRVVPNQRDFPRVSSLKLRRGLGVEAPGP